MATNEGEIRVIWRKEWTSVGHEWFELMEELRFGWEDFNLGRWFEMIEVELGEKDYSECVGDWFERVERKLEKKKVGVVRQWLRRLRSCFGRKKERKLGWSGCFGSRY